MLAAVRLVVDILTNNKVFANHPGGLLAAGAVIWATNVIAFGLWYWDLDRGGAAARAHDPYQNPAFIFPEMQNKEYVPATWVPRFVDYLSLASPALAVRRRAARRCALSCPEPVRE